MWKKVTTCTVWRNVQFSEQGAMSNIIIGQVLCLILASRLMVKIDDVDVVVLGDLLC